MKTVNFCNPSNSKEAYDLLIHCCFSGFDYEQTADNLKTLDYYIPRDQFAYFNEIVAIMMDLDIGNRQDERV